MNDVAAVIVTYNRKELLRQCLEKLQEQTVSLDIIVVDNASTDGTADLFRSSKDNIYYFNTCSNLGGAGGFNYGVRKGVEAGYRYLWLMDDDTFPTATSLAELLNAAKELDDNFGFLSSLAYWTDGQLCNMNIQRKNMKEKISLEDKNLTKIIMATFVSFFVKTETVQEIGLPIKDFFIWSDDLEYTRRISKKYDCYLITESKVVHAMKGNQKVNIVNDSDDRISRYRLLYRNEMYVYRREGIGGILYYMERVIYHILKVLMSKSNNKIKKIGIIFSSVKDGVHFNPPIEYV